ncbi:MAG: aspartate/glutamate racemase family protein [Anaerolineales bacterium]|nr:aspartate/glutamate racemase family protein [Anaerolineales bacterium]
MKILILNPNTSEDFTRAIQKAGEAVKSPGTEVVCLNPSSGPRSIESVYDELLSCTPCLEVLIAHQAEFDGFIIACYGNHPVIHAAREMLNQPVLGIMEASLYLACIAGHTFSVISSGDRAITMFWDAIKAFGIKERCASVRSTGTAVLALEGLGKEKVEDLILAEARKAVEEDGAEVISLGCAGMAGLDERLKRELGVPVVDGVAAAVKLIEALVGCGIQTSKRRAYSPLEGKELVNLPKVFSLPYDQNSGD